MDISWHWQRPVDPLATALAVFNLPSHANTGLHPQTVHLNLAPRPAGPSEPLRLQALSGQHLQAQLDERGVDASRVSTILVPLASLVYGYDLAKSAFHCFGTYGTFIVSADGALSSQFSDFPELIWAEVGPRRRLPPEILQTLRRDYVPQSQAFWVAQMCAVLKRIRPAAMVAAMDYDSKAQRPVWTGTELRAEETSPWFVCAYLQAGISAVGLPGGLTEVPYLDGKIVYSPGMLKCDVAAIAARVGAPDYDFNAEWEPLRQALANQPPQ